jgi:hypothetical protein
MTLFLTKKLSLNPQIREITKAFQVDWLINIIETVDIVKAETEVKKLQQKYPDKKPNNIAHHLIIEKAIYAGGMGLASGLLSGVTASMFIDIQAQLMSDGIPGVALEPTSYSTQLV